MSVHEIEIQRKAVRVATLDALRKDEAIAAAITGIPAGRLKKFAEGDDSALTDGEVRVLAEDLRIKPEDGDAGRPMVLEEKADGSKQDLPQVSRNDADVRISRRLEEIAKAIAGLEEEASALCVGKTAKVVSNFNGQPFGRSRRSLRGKTLTITSVYFDRSEYSFCAREVTCGVGPEDVEFI